MSDDVLKYMKCHKCEKEVRNDCMAFEVESIRGKGFSIFLCSDCEYDFRMLVINWLVRRK